MLNNPTLEQLHLSLDAQLAPDGIPLRYGDLEAEYQAALNQAVLLDRSHEGRLKIAGEDRFDFLNRMSTNNMLNMRIGEGRATVFTNPNARILQRVVAYNLPDYTLLLTEPGQAESLESFLTKQVFFNDKVTIENITAETNQFTIHGITADEIMLESQIALQGLSSTEAKINGHSVIIGRNKPLQGSNWFIIPLRYEAVAVYQQVLDMGKKYGLKPAGSLTYNALRIRSGRPAGRELSQDYIPLEVGLFDEISFNKGCYTGQEIIARMESRAQLARVLVHLNLDKFVEAPTDIDHNGRVIGRLTSSFIAPDQSIVALGVIKTQHANSGESVTINGIGAVVGEYAGQHPPYLETKQVEK